MNIYDYVFYRMYKSTAKVNDLYPEIPTIIFLSVMLFLNLFSIGLVMKISIESIGLNILYFVMTMIFIFNFYYFLKKDKFKQIIEKFDSEKRIVLLDILIFIYPFASFFVCFKLLKMSNGPIIFTMIGLLVIEIISLFYEKKE